MPLVRRVPKRGFTNIFRTENAEVNIEKLSRIKKKTIKVEDLVKSGIVKKKTQPVKILGRGKITTAKTVYAHKFSKSAQEKIEKAGGKVVLIGSE